MDRLVDTSILKFHPDTLEAVRRQCGLGAPGEAGRAVDILQQWIQQQPHFLRKDFPRDYLEKSIIFSKGSLERTKERLDKLCTMRTHFPKFFGDYHIEKDFAHFKGLLFSWTSTPTEEHFRVCRIKLSGNKFPTTFMIDYKRISVIIAEYLRSRDYMSGYLILFDLTEVNYMSLASAIDYVNLQQICSLLLTAYGFQVKGIHILSDINKIILAIVEMVKQFLSPKIRNRIIFHRTFEDLYKHIPKELLPADYGGYQKSLQDGYAEALKELSSPEHRSWVREMAAAGTDEGLRPRSARDDFYAGLPGTFRALDVD